MKNLLYLFLVLIPLMSFAQEVWVATGSGLQEGEIQRKKIC